jgi:hypothetical protein
MNDEVEILNQIISYLLNIYYSPTFGVIKFIIGIYVVVLFLDIVLLLFQRGVSQDLRITLFGSEVPVELMSERARVIKEWKRLKKNLESGEENKYKLVIIKADAIIENILDRLNYKGEDFNQKLANIPAGQVENLEEIKKAHEIRNKIIHFEDFPVDKQLAEKTIELYEEFLKSFGIFH